ncbi:MAG: shikimate dehydrogenase [Burkholderiaceae bacterium]
MEHRPFALAGLMGWPVAHSRSPDIHNHWMAEHGLRGAYVLLPVAPSNLAQALRALPVMGFAGCNLTIPHKVAAMALVDSVDAVARRIGAINTVVVQADGSLAGSNTDGFGYVHSLQQEQPGWRADAGAAVVIGAGGASRAVLVGLIEQGVREIRLCNRSDDKALALASELGAVVRAVPWAQRHSALAGAALLVNTTSQGMQGQAALDLELHELPPHAVVSDLVYVPMDTPLLRAARARGNPTVGGLGMLLHQAQAAYASWFGTVPAVSAALRAKVEASL